MKLDSQQQRLLLSNDDREQLGEALLEAADRSSMAGLRVAPALLRELGKALLFGWRIEKERRADEHEAG